MLQSMTGYATKTVSLQLHDQVSANMTFHIKSLNSRYFESSCKLPSSFTELEIPIQKLLKSKLSRGHIFVSIKIHNAEEVATVIKPSFITIESYLEAVEKIKSQFNFTDELTLEKLLTFPNTFQKEEIFFDDSVQKQVLEIINQMLEEVIISQQKEGLELEIDMLNQVKIMTKMIQKIKQESDLFCTFKKNQLDLLLHGLKAQEQDELSAQYCTMLAQKNNIITELEKIDINEEIIRFSSHLKNLEDIIAHPEIIKGKKIDFTLQELNREANTIASKCSHVEISSIIIDIKSTLEKAREQAHNIF